MAGRLLLVAWLVLVATIAGLGTWLYATQDIVEERRAEANRPVIAMVADTPRPAGIPPPPESPTATEAATATEDATAVATPADAEQAPTPTGERARHAEAPVAPPPPPSSDPDTATAEETVEETAGPPPPADPPAEMRDEVIPGGEQGREAPAEQAVGQVAAVLRSHGMNPIDAALVEQGINGLVPTIAPDGRKPWRHYARPASPTDGRPGIAIVVTHLGLQRTESQAAIQTLPGDVTLAFAPYAPDVDRWVQLARIAGHEVLLALPMEPTGFPREDPGPNALLVDLDPRENLERLDWVLSRAGGYVGVISHMGSRFTTVENRIRPIMNELRNRGLLFVDSRTDGDGAAIAMGRDVGLPVAAADRFVDAEPSANAIDERLAELERIARRTGIAIGIARPYPVTLQQINEWARDVRERGFRLVPISAAVDARADH